MDGGKQPVGFRGYTIVEVLIVLAVSGVMFVIAATFVSGKQARASFQQGTRTLTANIQSTIDSVVDGQYTDIPLICTLNSTIPRTLSFLPGSSARQGSNPDCTFLGQVLHFDFDAAHPASSTYQRNYETLVLAAAKTSSTSGPLTTIADSVLTPVNLSHGTVNLTSQHVVPQNLDVEGMKITYINASGNPVDQAGVYDIGFVQGLGSVDSASTPSYASGAQSLRLIANLNIGANQSISASLDQGNVNAQVSKAILCITDGDRHATITIGGNNNQLSAVSQNVADGSACR